MTREEIEQLADRLHNTLEAQTISKAFENHSINDGKFAEDLLRIIGESERALRQLLNPCVKTYSVFIIVTAGNQNSCAISTYEINDIETEEDAISIAETIASKSNEDIGFFTVSYPKTT